jgi:Signal transduction histidine kinase
MLGPLEDEMRENPKAYPRLEIAHRNSLRLLKLVNTLLDFSRIEAGRIQAVYEPTDLAVYTVELASVFRSAIEKAGLRLVIDTVRFALSGSKIKAEFHLPEDLWIVDIDEGQIVQVLNNLTINAEQAMPTGGILEIDAENVFLYCKPI